MGRICETYGFGKSASGQSLNLTDIATHTIEISRYPEGSRYVAKTRNQSQAPDRHTRNSYFRKAPGSDVRKIGRMTTLRVTTRMIGIPTRGDIDTKLQGPIMVTD